MTSSLNQNHTHHSLRNPQEVISSCSDRSSWLDESHSRAGSVTMSHSLSEQSQYSLPEQARFDLSLQATPLHPNPPHPPQRHQSQHGELESEPLHHRSSHHQHHRVPSVIHLSHPNHNENQDPNRSEEAQPQWNQSLAKTFLQGPTFSYIDANESKAETEQPQLASVRVSKACVPCRDKRVKCEGGYPHCTSCIEKDRTGQCVYRVIPPRSVTRKTLDDLQTRLNRAEDRLHLSNDDNRELRARLWEAERELQKLKSGDKIRELERLLRETQLRLEADGIRHPSPVGSQEVDHHHQYSPSQGSNFSFGTAGDASASPYTSPSIPRWSDDQEAQEPFHPNKRPQYEPPSNRSPYSRPERIENAANRRFSAPRTVERSGFNRRRAATTTNIGSSHSLYTNQAPISSGLNINFGTGENSENRNHHQNFSNPSQPESQGLPRSASVLSGSTLSPAYPASSFSLPLPSPPHLDLRYDYLAVRSMERAASPPLVKTDSQLESPEPCYLRSTFENSLVNPASTTLEANGRNNFNYEFAHPKTQQQTKEIQNEDQNFNQKYLHSQASSHHVSHSHSQSLPANQFTFKPHYVKDSSENTSSDASIDSGIIVSEHQKRV